MNRNRLQRGCRISIQIVLLISLLVVTYFQFLKYNKELANVSISYNDGKQDLELPSLTFCPFGESPNVQKHENMTFEGYMEHILNVSDFFTLTANASGQSVYLPGLLGFTVR